MSEGLGGWFMFILGLRDAYGLKITIWLFLIWHVYFFVALYADIVWLSLALLFVAVSATCYCSFLLCKHRADLIFSSRFAKEHGFPSNHRNSQATFIWHLAGFLLFFLAPLLATSIAFLPPVPDDKMPFMYAGYLLGLPGVVGLFHHFVRKVVDRGVKQTSFDEISKQGND